MEGWFRPAYKNAKLLFNIFGLGYRVCGVDTPKKGVSTLSHDPATAAGVPGGCVDTLQIECIDNSHVVTGLSIHSKSSVSTNHVVVGSATTDVSTRLGVDAIPRARARADTSLVVPHTKDPLTIQK